MDSPVCREPDRNPRRPGFPVPRGTVDCHAHVFGDPKLFPLIRGRSYTPARASVDDYLSMCGTTGIGRTIQVNASVYGFDNSITLHVIRKLGQRRALGIAGLSPDASTKTVASLHKQGIRGVRLSTMVEGYGGTDVLDRISPKIKVYGWHVQLHVDRVGEIKALENKLLNCDVPLVFDHLGRVRGAEGVRSPGFQALLRIIRERDDCWVKLSSWYRLSDSGMPGCEDMQPVVHALVKTRPDRLVWGSNWPHPIWNGMMPNDGDLLDQLCTWVGNPETIRRILVDNPQELYGFA